MTVTAADLLALLRERHQLDVFVSECKNGPTHTASHLRLDAWVLKRSWANPCAIGYEIKSSRSDFTGDKKWPGYLPLCNRFYFVAPKGLIKPTELPVEVGLLEPTARGLHMRKRALYRDVAIPDELLRYVLICRTRPGPAQPLQPARLEICGESVFD